MINDAAPSPATGGIQKGLPGILKPGGTPDYSLVSGKEEKI
jgi:hypothetical protein